MPAGRHPVQALIDMVKQKGLEVDVVLSPGDLTDQIAPEGMMQAWDHLCELQRVLKAPTLLTTLGNHDVDSKKEKGPEPFKIAQTLHPDFPLVVSTERDCFWANGFFHRLVPPLAEFIVLNTVIDHVDEVTAKRGTFDSERIALLKSSLERWDAEHDPLPLRIALMHHHPILHSNVNFGSNDVLAFGDQLLSMLAERGFQIVIHGHRHDPRITRVVASGRDVFVIAAGSFAAMLKELASTTRNLFHVLTVQLESDGAFTARLRSWEFNYGDGWNASSQPSARFPHVVGFGSGDRSVEIADIIRRVEENLSSVVTREEVASLYPKLSLWLPDELVVFRNDLLNNHRIKMVVDSDGTIDSIGRVR